MNCSSPRQVLEPAATGVPWFAEPGNLDVTHVDPPTGHWPMLARPADLAKTIAAAATGSLGEEEIAARTIRGALAPA